MYGAEPLGRLLASIQANVAALDTSLRCSCCGLPWARVENGTVIVQSRHHGEVHTNAIAIEELVKMCQTERSTPDEPHQTSSD